ncbi:MAG: DUF488 family protein [Microbacteriaceae bacterium]
MGRIIGIGYEGLDSEGLIARLKLRGVSTLVDVRLNPISRKRGLSKRALSESLANSGITYIHLPALGNPRENREGFADLTGAEGRGVRKRYRTRLKSPEALVALQNVEDVSAHGLVALLCFEGDPDACHRQLVLEALAERAPALAS